MKCLILAAGEGKRMRPHTNDLPKPLIKINGRNFISYNLKNVMDSGISEIGVVVGYKKEMIEEWIKKSHLKIETIEQDEQLGTGHAIKISEDWIGKDNFVVMMGDNLYSARDIFSIQIIDKFCYVGGIAHDKPENFGVLVENNGLLEKILEKPSADNVKFLHKPVLINTGLYKFTHDIFDSLKKIKKSKRGEYEITDAISLLCRNQLVRIVKMQDYWINFGCPEDIPVVKDFVEREFE